MTSTFEALLLAQVNYLLNNTPQKIGGQILTGTTASVTIPVPANTFSALQVTYSARSDFANTATYMDVRFNADSANDYVWQINQANNATMGPGGSGAATNIIKAGTMPAASATANFFGAGEFVIGNPNSSVFKPISSQASSMITVSNSYSGTYGGLWESTAVITSITLLPDSGNFVAGSQISLYGIP